MKILFVLPALLMIPTIVEAGCTRAEHPDWTQAQIERCINETPVEGTNQNLPGGQQAQSAQQNNNVPYNNCQRTYSTARNSTGPQPAANITSYYVNGQKAQTVPTPAAGATTIPGVAVSSNDDLRFCRGMEIASERFGGDLSSVDNKRSQDGRITCVQKSGITADWESCVSAVGMYNSIIVAESAMQVFQGVQTNRVQNQAANEAAQRTAAGDGQNAMYDAQTANLNNAKELNQQQAAAYAAAVAALYSKIQSWIKEDKTVYTQKGCGQGPQIDPQTRQPAAAEPSATMMFQNADSVPGQENCVLATQKAFDRYRNIAYANRDAKADLTRAAMMFAAKAIQAGIKASQLGKIAEKVQEAKKSTEDPYNPATFEYCAVNNSDPKCGGTTTRTPGSGLQDGGFSFGDSFGNNAIGGLGEEEKLGNDPLAPLAGDDTVADVSNPFTDDAKKASGILDPAGAASISPGQGAGGGGGGGAPGLGGGSASLGNDVPGVDESKKESDIKANKADGKYSDATGAGGFQAIKPLKEDNPFANLFGGQGGGKLEEDRSIASGDIDGQDSGLFAKISKRYGQVQADKRIEAKNLDE